MAQQNLAGSANLEIVVSVNDMASKQLKALEKQLGKLSASGMGGRNGGPSFGGDVCRN